MEITEEELEALPDHQKRKGLVRALRALDIAFEDDSDDYLETLASVDPEGLYDEEFIQEFHRELSIQVVDNALAGLVKKGLFEIVGVNDEGSYKYKRTEKGDAAHEALSGA